LYASDFGLYSQYSPNYCELKRLQEKQIAGTLDISDCIPDNPPVVISHPHFAEGDPKLCEMFEGLEPEKFNTPQTCIYVVPRFGVTVFLSTKIQFNLRVSSLSKYYTKLNDVILPVAWIETSLEEPPIALKMIFYVITYVVDGLEIILKYGSILVLLISSICLIRNILIFRRKNSETNVI
jgi:hypothetical protein